MFLAKMFNFFKNGKNPINSNEYEQLCKRIVEISAKQEILDSKVEVLRTDTANLRGRFNQRLKGFAKEEEETKDINTGENIYIG